VAVTATRGNFGQAVAFAARREGMEAVVYVPYGNSPGKNRAMRSLGARLVEHGEDFEEARQEARRWAEAGGHHYVPSFHEWLVEGTATYSWELLRAVERIDVAFVPIGMGSGILGMCAAREALGLKTEIVGVVSAHARAYYESFVRREVVVSPARTRLADGMAVPAPDARALEGICAHVSRVLMVSDDEVAAAMRAVFDDTHNVAEGAGAAAVAAILKERDGLRGKRVAAVLSGGNVDRAMLAEVLG
jgi:threonine dehydratase